MSRIRRVFLLKGLFNSESWSEHQCKWCEFTVIDPTPNLFEDCKNKLKTDALLPLTKTANYSSLCTAHLAGNFLLQCGCQICDSFVAGFGSSPFATESHYESFDVLGFWRLCWGSVWTQGFANIQASISTSRQVASVGIWVIWRS
jgi:hypothetical protein